MSNCFYILRNQLMLFYKVIRNIRGGSRIFSRGGGADFQKVFENFEDLFSSFLGRPNLIFELSQSTVLPLFWQNFLRRRQIFEKKNSQKRRF